MVISGEILRDDTAASEYDNYTCFRTNAVRWHPVSESVEDLVSFTVRNVLLTSYFIPIDVAQRRMFIHQTYSNIENFAPTRFQVEGDGFCLTTTPIPLSGRYVVFGGPIDSVWYHWLINWCLRLIALQRLRPELFDDADVKFIVHPLAMAEPYRAILDTFGIPASRLVPIDPGEDYVLEQATLVSFCDQVKLYPELIRALATHLRGALALTESAPARNVFPSRQSIGVAKRRIHNFAELEPVLRRWDFDILALGGMSAREQAQAFYNADIVVGAHGSDLANILFCKPGAKLIVFENETSIARDDYLNLKFFAEVLDVHYEAAVTPTFYPGGVKPSDYESVKNADFIVDVTALDDRLAHYAAGPGWSAKASPIKPKETAGLVAKLKAAWSWAI